MSEPTAGHNSKQPTAKAALRRILVVDDNVDAAESLAMVLKMNGHEAHCVHDAQAALLTSASFKPDTILLDIGLPGMDGYEVAKSIRAENTRVVLIALTGYGYSEDIARAKAAGFDAHLLKPLDFDELERNLDTLRGPT